MHRTCVEAGNAWYDDKNKSVLWKRLKQVGSRYVRRDEYCCLMECSAAANERNVFGIHFQVVLAGDHDRTLRLVRKVRLAEEKGRCRRDFSISLRSQMTPGINATSVFRANNNSHYHAV